jgi:Tfp pilus assembly protein PilF
VVDFEPGVNLRSQLVMPVSEATVIAMFMNNRAAESISAGRLDAAYWWAREAVLQDSRYVAAYNTLAVIYKRKGLLSEAISLLGFAHDAAPKDPVVLANLADFLRDAGRGPEAAIIEAKLKAIEPYPPYYFFQRALAALKNSDFAGARELFGKDLARQPYNAEFHFGMATTYIAEGDWRHAREHLDQAREYGTTADSRAIYSAKLESLDRQLKKLNCRRPSCDQSG